MKQKLIHIALWLADVHTSCAAFWNSVAESLHTGETLAEIKERRKRGEQE